MTEQIREKRSTETRATFERPAKWKPAATLPDPIPEPGWVHHWVRVSLLNSPDPSNISAKLGEGWEPVKANTQPHILSQSSSNSRFADGIEIGGLLLCKTPEEFVADRNAHYQKLANAQMASVDNTFMRESNSKMPLFKESSSRVTIGRNQ